jgi:hypothetical protein
MGAHGTVVPPGGGLVWNMAPGRSAALKLLNGETGESVMMFEETALPAPRPRSICTTTAARLPTS